MQAHIATGFSRRFGLRYPIVSAPMGGVSGGALAAAVSNAGALGFVGGGYGDAAWVEEQLALVSASTPRPWGIGFISWHLRREVLELALRFKPAAVMLSFGAVAPWAPLIKASGSALGCQVQDAATAAQALEAGADFIVAQGGEAGGHGGEAATLPLVPLIVDLAGDVPVLAAGGIADGRGVAAALALGAQGAMLGTRFYASNEALGHPRLKNELVANDLGGTIKTQIFDVLRGYDWPAGFRGRAIRNGFVSDWLGRPGELAGSAATLLPGFRDAQAHGDVDRAMIWAGDCIGLIHDVEPAAELVRRIGDDAARILARLGAQCAT